MKKIAVRSAIALLALIALVWAMHFFAGPEAPPSQVTRVAGGAGGCQNESYANYGSDWDVEVRCVVCQDSQRSRHARRAEVHVGPGRLLRSP